MKEWINGEDIHSNNQRDIGLPTRLIAKRFLFRNIYHGQASTYARDPEFTTISSSVQYWQNIIDAFNEKYNGIATFQNKIIKQAAETKKITSPLGRSYIYESYVDKFTGQIKWPESDICNHINQGFGSDLMALARIYARRRFKEHNLYPDALLVNTVHDSLLADAKESCYNIVSKILTDSIESIPSSFESVFGIPFNIPMRGEISIGSNYANLEEVK